MPTDPLASFPTRSLRSIPAITSEQMIEVDRLATRDAELSLLQMMENAGRSLALVIDAYVHAEQEPDGSRAREGVGAAGSGPVLVLAGSGGNGGGALAAARHLRNWGRDVQVVLAAPRETSTRPPRSSCGRCTRMGCARSGRRRRVRRALPGAAAEGGARGGRPDRLQLRGPLQGDPALLVEAAWTGRHRWWCRWTCRAASTQLAGP